MTLPPGLAAVEAALREFAGAEPDRAQVSFVGVDALEVVRFHLTDGRTLLASLGMSRTPMTPATEAIADAAGPRAELAVEVRDPARRFPTLWRSVAVLAATPAVESVVFTAGVTVDLGEPWAAGSRWTGVVVAEPLIAAISTPDGPVDVLSALPATATELAWCRVHGSAALRERWRGQQIDLLDPERAPAALD